MPPTTMTASGSPNCKLSETRSSEALIDPHREGNRAYRAPREQLSSELIPRARFTGVCNDPGQSLNRSEFSLRCDLKQSSRS
jgi:hypothetical protein